MLSVECGYLVVLFVVNLIYSICFNFQLVALALVFDILPVCACVKMMAVGMCSVENGMSR